MAENSKIEWITHIDVNATGRTLGSYKSAAKKIGVSLETWFAYRLSGRKWCFRCRQWQKQELFCVDSHRGGGQSSQCKECASKASTRSRYRLTRDQHEKLETTHCPICERPEQIMVVDHNHETGKIRGMLCSRCNVGLGLFCDDPDLLQHAIRYLEKHSG